MKRLTGRIVTLRQDRGYGWIEQDGTRTQFFAHASAFREYHGISQVAIGTRVAFQEGPSEGRGRRAAQITIVQGVN